MTGTEQNFRREVSGLTPEDTLFISGVLQVLTAMYCRQRPNVIPLPIVPETRPKSHDNKEEEKK